jgi:hypothetical protein
MKARLRMKPLLSAIALIALSTASAAQTKDSAAFKIETIPSGADVSVNGIRVGRTPLELLGYAPGPYAFSISLRGYDVEEFSVNALAGSRHAYRLPLKKREGRLILSVIPENAEVAIDGLAGEKGILALDEGVHIVSARLFGFAEERRTVEIRKDEESPVEILLRPAPFRIDGFSASRSAFDPSSPPPFGETFIRFLASAPGSAIVKILSPAGGIVAERPFTEFKTWEQGFAWDGRDGFGKPLPDGTYRVNVETKEPSGLVQEFEILVRIDSSIRHEPRLLSAMASGSLLCPDAGVAPPGSLEVRIDSLLPVSVDWSGGFPFWTGLRAGIAKNLEGAMTARILSGAPDWALEASLKYRYASFRGAPSLQGAVFIRGLLPSSGDASLGSAGGTVPAVDAGFPLTLGAGSLEGSLCPAAGIGFAPAGISPRAGGAASIGFRSASFSLRASADAWWTIPSIAWASAPRLGIDASFLTPALVTLSAGVLAEFGAETSFSVLLGAGFIF